MPKCPAKVEKINAAKEKQHQQQKKRTATAMANCGLVSALLSRKCNLKRGEANYAASQQHHSPAAQRAAANGELEGGNWPEINAKVDNNKYYIHLEMPLLQKPSNGCMLAEEKEKRTIFDFPAVDKVPMPTKKSLEEDGYTEIDNMFVDVLRLRNRELLKTRFSASLLSDDERKRRFSDRPTPDNSPNANIFGSVKNISAGTKPDVFGANLAGNDLICRSTLNLSFERRPRGNTANSGPGAFPTVNGPNSPIKSCKKIIAQQQHRRALSPPLRAAKVPFPTEAEHRPFLRANSCQSLGMSDGIIQHNRPKPNNLDRVPSSFVKRFPPMRIDPAPILPERNKNKPPIKSDKNEVGAWERAEINLQKIIKTMEEDTTNAYMELKLHHSTNEQNPMENIYHEFGTNNQTNEYAEIRRFSKNSQPRNSKAVDNKLAMRFLSQFLAIDLHQLAVWMSEEDCLAFGWPPSEQKSCHFFWSLNEEGAKIRAEIGRRSKLMQHLVENSLQKGGNVLEKWIQLADELHNSLGNHFAFMNIMGILTEKINEFPAFFHAVETQQSALLFRTKLLQIYNFYNEKPGNFDDSGENILLPHIGPYLEKIFNQEEKSKTGAKIDLLWTFIQLARKMFSATNRTPASPEGNAREETGLFNNANIESILLQPNL